MLHRSIDVYDTNTIAEIILRALFYFGDFDAGTCLCDEDIKNLLALAADFPDHRLYAALRDDLAESPPF